MIESDTLDVKYRVSGTTVWQGNTGSSSISADTWYNFVITHDGTAPKFYLNGSDVTNLSNTSTQTAWITAGTGLDNFTLGALDFNGGGNSDFGKFYCDDFAVWNVALPATGTGSVASLYNSGTGALATTIPSGL